MMNDEIDCKLFYSPMPPQFLHEIFRIPPLTLLPAPLPLLPSPLVEEALVEFDNLLPRYLLHERQTRPEIQLIRAQRVEPPMHPEEHVDGVEPPQKHHERCDVRVGLDGREVGRAVGLPPVVDHPEGDHALQGEEEEGEGEGAKDLTLLADHAVVSFGHGTAGAPEGEARAPHRHKRGVQDARQRRGEGEGGEQEEQPPDGGADGVAEREAGEAGEGEAADKGGLGAEGGVFVRDIVKLLLADLEHEADGAVLQGDILRRKHGKRTGGGGKRGGRGRK